MSEVKQTQTGRLLYCLECARHTPTEEIEAKGWLHVTTSGISGRTWYREVDVDVVRCTECGEEWVVG